VERHPFERNEFRSAFAMTRISVLMSVYNGLPYLRQAVESVRAQTWRDWQLVVVDDGSGDGSADYLAGLRDERVVVLRQTNQGLAAALNHGLRHCDGQFVARLDADDVAEPTRLAEQSAFLQRNAAVGLVGTQFRYVGQRRAGKPSRLPCDHPRIVAALSRGDHALVHSSIMARTELLRRLSGYWPSGVAEDWDLYLRIGEITRLANLDQVLLLVRVHGGSINGSQVSEVRRRIGFACDQARRRHAGEPPLEYEEYVAGRQAAPLWQRVGERLDTYAMRQYRLALGETLGTRPLRGYARLAWAALCSPGRTKQRMARWLRPRGENVVNGLPTAMAEEPAVTVSSV
jgi:glycosyltransferase involved in cell wall biosynthesis